MKIHAIQAAIGMILGTTAATETYPWRHDADKWGIAFVVCTILFFFARYIARREEIAQKAANEERAALLSKNNELSEKILEQQISHGRRMEKLVEQGNAAQSNTSQAITSWTRKMKRPCIMQSGDDIAGD